MQLATSELCYTIFQGKNIITKDIVEVVIREKGVEEGTGLSDKQMKALEVLKSGYTMGQSNLAFRIGVTPKELEKLVEPYLLLKGYMDRTSRGRVITDAGKLLIN